MKVEDPVDLYSSDESYVEGFEEYENDVPPRGLADIAEHPNFAGIWSWSRGGGWVGPYIKNELWCDLNAYVISRYGQDPSRSEEELFFDYCKTLDLNEQDAQQFRKLSLLSADGVGRGLKTLVLERGRPVRHREDYPTAWKHPWEFDYRGRLPEDVLNEKKQCVEIWQEINQIANNFSSGSQDFKQYLIVSSKYGLLKYSIIEQAWIVMLKGLEGENSGNFDVEKIKNALIEYDKLWIEFKKLKEKNDNCATLYVPYSFVFRAPGFHETAGMHESVNRYRKLIHENESFVSNR